MILLYIVIPIAAALVGFATGYSWEHRARLAEVAQIRAEIAQREVEAAEEARNRIEAAQKAADEAIAKRDARIQSLNEINRRLRHDLEAATTGRPCLSASTRWLLQQSPAFSTDMPKDSDDTASAPSTTTADSW